MNNPTKQFPEGGKKSASDLNSPEFYGVPNLSPCRFGFARKFKCPVCGKEMGRAHKKSLQSGKGGKWISCSNTRKKIVEKANVGGWTTSFRNPHKIKRGKKNRPPLHMNAAERERWNSEV